MVHVRSLSFSGSPTSSADNLCRASFTENIPSTVIPFVWMEGIEVALRPPSMNSIARCCGWSTDVSIVTMLLWGWSFILFSDDES